MTDVSRLLKWDVQIDQAIREGDNDAALEYSIWQKQYYERYCTEERQLTEWKKRTGKL